MAEIELESTVTGVVWKLAALPGQQVSIGDPVVIVESMKMEIPVEATVDGRVAELLVAAGDQITENKPIAILEVA